MNTFFTSDTHFGHARIIGYADRPFLCVEEMDEALISNWNARVGRRDVVYHLGDFGLGEVGRNANVLARLNGIKHLLLGNHDRATEMAALGWSSVNHYLRRSIAGKTYCMCHYPFLTWERRHRNVDGRVESVNLFGHVHSTTADPKLQWDRCQYDVGVDNNAYAPVSSDEIVAALRSRVVDRV